MSDTKKKTDELDTIFIRGIPHHIKVRFKAWCATYNLSMTEVISRVMEEATHNSNFGNALTAITQQPRH